MRVSKNLVVATIVGFLVAWLFTKYGRRFREAFGVTYEVIPTGDDIDHADSLVRLEPVEGKGTGVVAIQDIPAWTFIAPYPGRRYTAAEHQKRKDRGWASDEYAVEFWATVDGEMDENYVLDPMVHTNRGSKGRTMPSKYLSVAPYINEPDEGELPNLVWVWNFPKYRVELWTRQDIKAGEELSVCYGADFDRGYKTGCKKSDNEPVRYAIVSEGATPSPWTDVVDSDDDDEEE